MSLNSAMGQSNVLFELSDAKLRRGCSTVVQFYPTGEFPFPPSKFYPL